MAQAGLGSRRRCEDLIAAGRVEVNGQVAVLGTRVDQRQDVVRVDGARIPTAPGLVHVALNKPRSVVSTMSDERGRRSLADYVADYETRLFHVGRLDTDTEGLILLTNDGDLAHRLAHPSFGLSKVYVAEVRGQLRRDVGRRLRAGVRLADGTVRVDGFRVLDRAGPRALVEVTLHEGRKHVVRRLLAAVGHPVQHLVRTQFGPIRLGSLRPGTARTLTPQEVMELYRAVGL
ncbi:MAG: pseudouridine synthase [Streptosporangiales bacterium]|nr:pseudouridine synthase [Streptosporangiales bacterium]